MKKGKGFKRGALFKFPYMPLQITQFEKCRKCGREGVKTKFYGDKKWVYTCVCTSVKGRSKK